MEQILASNDAERGAIASALLNTKALNFVIERFVESDFYYLNNRIMFQAICDIMKGEADGVDSICVKDWLIKNKLFNQVGGDSGLVEYFSMYVLSARLPEYHKIIKDFSRRRELDVMAKKICEQVNDIGSNLDDVIYTADDSLKGMREGATNFKHEMSELMDVDRLQSMGTYLKTGIKAIDSQIYGLFASELSIIAASTSMGKSSLALNIAENVAVNHRVLVFSLEMSADSLAIRTLSGRTRIEYRKIRVANTDMYQQKALADEAEVCKKLNLCIIDNNNATIEYIRNESIVEHQDRKVELIIVDFLQHVSCNLKGNERYEHVTRGCKDIARNLECPVILVSQLNREVARRVNNVPQLSDLRGAGEIEEYSDNVYFLYRDKNDVTCWLTEKSRNAPLGSTELNFDKRYTKFR